MNGRAAGIGSVTADPKGGKPGVGGWEGNVTVHAEEGAGGLQSYVARQAAAETTTWALHLTLPQRQTVAAEGG